MHWRRRCEHHCDVPGLLMCALADVGLMEVVNTRLGRWTEAGKHFADRRPEYAMRSLTIYLAAGTQRMTVCLCAG
jgi:hypothetical protein